MKRLTIERRIRHLQREMVKLSLSSDPRRKRLLSSLTAALAIERSQLHLVRQAS